MRCLYVAVSIVGLALVSFTFINTEGASELTFSTLVVETGELRPEGEFRASCASEKTSSSASDASWTTVSSYCMRSSIWKLEGAITHPDHVPRDLQAQRSCEEGLESGFLEDDRDLPFRKVDSGAIESQAEKKIVVCELTI